MANDRLGFAAPIAMPPVRQPAYMGTLQSMYGPYSNGIQVAQAPQGPGLADTMLGMLAASGTGAVLGVLQSELKNGLDYGGKVPIDASFALLSIAGGLAYGSHASVRAGQNAIAIYTFRKSIGMLTLLRGMVTGKPPTVVTPDMTEDSLENAAKEL